jgi:gas vesicle protein
MGPGPDEVDDIRRQIEESRENLGEAVGALAYKADIKNRGKEALEDKKEAVMEKVDELKSKATGDGGIGDKVKDKLPDPAAMKDSLPSGEDVSQKVDAVKSKLPDGVGDATGRISDAAPSKEDVKAKAQDAAGVMQDHPIAVAAGAAAAGLAAGLALPETELERQKLAPTARQVREQVQARAQEVVEQVKEGAKDAIGSTADAVRQAGQQQGGKVAEVAEKAADKTQEKL